MSKEELALRLYVTGQSPNSEKALANIEQLLGEMSYQHHLDVIDILEQPALAERDGIIASPTLVKRNPPPVRRIIGDLSDRENVLSSLDVAAPPVGVGSTCHRCKATPSHR